MPSCKGIVSLDWNKLTVMWVYLIGTAWCSRNYIVLNFLNVLGLLLQLEQCTMTFCGSWIPWKCNPQLLMVGARFCEFTGGAIRGCMKHSPYSEGQSYVPRRQNYVIEVCYTTISLLGANENFKFKREFRGNVSNYFFNLCSKSK